MKLATVNPSSQTLKVTTTRINHASPSGAYANSAYRFWYDDTALDKDFDDGNMDGIEKSKCVDLATQFVKVSFESNFGYVWLNLHTQLFLRTNHLLMWLWAVDTNISVRKKMRISVSSALVAMVKIS